jgi:hypothetical protein
MVKCGLEFSPINPIPKNPLKQEWVQVKVVLRDE